jgi:hypothetical protein
MIKRMIKQRRPARRVDPMEYRTRGLMLARLVDAQWWWLRRMLTFVELRTKAQGGTCRNETDEVGAARALGPQAIRTLRSVGDNGGKRTSS